MVADLIENALNRYAPISLDEMDCVRLMDRIDTKYIFSAACLNDLLNIVPSNYKVFKINGQYNLPYKTIYLDTHDHLFYQQQMRGKLNIHKVRFRVYESTDTSFLEIKFKSNKSRTIKLRINCDLVDYCINNEAFDFISKNVDCDAYSLKPAMISRFDRITLVRLETKERITIDSNISFSSIDETQKVSLPFLAIVESKHDDYSNRSSFVRSLKNLHLQPMGFSKYCVGSAMLYNLPRQNILKSKFYVLQKIANEYHTTNLARSN